MRTTINYLQGLGKLNNASSVTAGGSAEPVTGLPISTGSNSGDFLEVTDAQALALSTNGIVGVIILTAGSAQTPGTYTLAASAGGASISVVVAAGGTVTALPTVTVPGNGAYSVIAAPTFTLAAGGTPATFAAVVGKLNAGVYQRVKLNAAVVTAAVGQALYWLRTDTSDPYAVTNVSSTTSYDYAGTYIDSNLTAGNYVWIQVNGRVQGLASAAGAIGQFIGFAVTATNQYVTSASAIATASGVGTQATVAAGAGQPFLFDVRIAQARY